MPGACTEAEDDPALPGAFHELACIGNRVRDGAGRSIGVVVGKCGGLAPGFMPPIWCPSMGPMTCWRGWCPVIGSCSRPKVGG
jgi:hypothetical protein